jgi:lysophospholipase L1-like esterase
MSAALLAAKLALGPLLLPQAHWVRRTALRLPEAAGVRQGRIGRGEVALRLLVVGDSSAAGVGVADQAQALALPLAKLLSEKLGAAVAWQLVAQSGVNAAQAIEMLAQAQLQPADVVVTVLGVNDVGSQTPASQFSGQLSLLWDLLRERTGARWAVACGVPPMHLLTAVPQPLRWYLGRYAGWLDVTVRGWTQQQGLGYCALHWAADPGNLALDGFHPGPGLYPKWAGRLAGIIDSNRSLWAVP